MHSIAHRTVLKTFLVTAASLLLALMPVCAQAQETPSLTQLQFDIVGARLSVDPPTLTVPKSIPTQVNTFFDFPDGVTQDVKDQVLAAFAADAEVEAELRGPSFAPMRVRARPGQPLPIPPFALPGDYFLDNIRLVKNDQVLLDAVPSTVPITVISEVFVTSVSTRPLTSAEIRERGIVIDENNFQVINFELAFDLGKGLFRVDVPLVLPLNDLPDFVHREQEKLLLEMDAINQRLVEGVKLPPELQRPGLNFSITPIPALKAEEGEDLEFGAPPIQGLLVIPGNVAFLNQFFSVQLILANVAPGASLLSLRDVQAKIVLPTGLDRVPGTFEQSGDDPLRLARIEGVGQRAEVLVVQRGPDGQLGTADDLTRIPAQKIGEAEFLVEGLREGSHTLDIAIRATLDGLPSGPVSLSGSATGAVLVRNPTFALTLGHPRTVLSGEPYELYATLTNTSRTPANLVSVNLDPRSIAGAQLLSAETVEFDSIPPGESRTTKFSMRAQKTGYVAFSQLTFGSGLTSRFQLRTGVDERGVPLAPLVIVFPKSTKFLPTALVDAAQRVLGQALSIALAPAESLPPEVLFIPRETIIARGRELGEAGQRVEFGEPLPRVLADLLLDWLGNRTADDGFDQLLRTTEAGEHFLTEIGDILNQAVSGSSALDLQHAIAETTVARTPHLSAIAGLRDGPAPVRLSITNNQGQTVGPNPRGASLPYANLVNIQESPDGRSDLALVSRLNAPRYTVTVTGSDNGRFDLGIIVPNGVGRLTQLRYENIAIDAGGEATVMIDLEGANTFFLAVDRNGDGIVEQNVAPVAIEIVEGPPQILRIQQLVTMGYFGEGGGIGEGGLRDPATLGLAVGVLFDKPVTKATAEAIANYAIEANGVRAAALQPSGRLVYLLLERPIGTLVARNMTVTNVADARTFTLPQTTAPIHTVHGDGAQVLGVVRNADGSPVANALLELGIEGGEGRVTTAVVHTDARGAFTFDFVLLWGTGDFYIIAQHPVSKAFAKLRPRIRAPGQILLLNPTFRGFGTVRGRVLAADGTLVPDALVKLTPRPAISAASFAGLLRDDADEDESPRDALTNAAGEYVFTNVLVGNYTVRAADRRGGVGQATGVISAAGQEAITDIQLITTPSLATLTGRVFLSDGATPAVGFPVYAGYFPTGGRGEAFVAYARAITDAAGSFIFADLLAGDAGGRYDVVALDPTTRQVGVAKIGLLPPRQTTSVNIVFEALGAVEGLVRNAQGQLVQGALVAGGIALGETDANGHFRIDGVPAGQRAIEAGDPRTKRRGSTQVTVLPGQTVSVAITLEARASIEGQILDAAGQPVPRAVVRVPLGCAGFLVVIANLQGVYRLPDLNLGEYLLQAPGPDWREIVSRLRDAGTDPRLAFTAGDLPPELDSQASDPSDTNAIIAAFEQAAQKYVTSSSLPPDLPQPSPEGGFGYNKVRLFEDSTTVTADIRYLPQGTVSGATVDSNSLPTGALMRLITITPGESGCPLYHEYPRSRIRTDPQTGAFSYSVARFDQATFAATGIKELGKFRLEAVTPFSPALASFEGRLDPNTLNMRGILLQFPSAAETNGTIGGRVFLPDGVTPAPEGTVVRISFGDLAVTTDANGHFESRLPIPGETGYLITAEEPFSGLRGQTGIKLPAGGHVDVDIRLLGLGNVTAIVQRPDGQRVANAALKFNRIGFPFDELDGHTDANGVVHFVNVSEGEFAILAIEQGTGLAGRASGTVVRDDEVAVLITITGAGRVTGMFVSPDGNPIANAQIVLLSGGVKAFATTDANGRFELLAIPVGHFIVEGSDPISGRLGRASGDVRFEGDSVDVTIVPLPRGTVEGRVLQGDRVTPAPGAVVEITVESFAPIQLQTTARSDGSFRFEGVPAGAFHLQAADAIGGILAPRGEASGTFSVEGEVVTKDIILEGTGAIRVKVLDETGAPFGQAEVALFEAKIAPELGVLQGRKATVDVNGEFTYDFLKLGDYALVAHALTEVHNGGEATASLTQPGQTVEVEIRLRGVGTVPVKVVAADGVTPIASAQITLTARAAFGEEQPRPFGPPPFLAFTNAQGEVTIPGVPVGDFFVMAELGPLGGVSDGTLSAPNVTAPITIRLTPSGSIHGRVLLPDGMTAAAQAFVTLRFDPQSSLSSGVVQVTTNVLGEFAFVGIPIGPFSLRAEVRTRTGVRGFVIVTGSLDTDGQKLDLGNLILDDTAPRVVTISPSDGSFGVAVQSPIVLTFNEPMLTTSFLTFDDPRLPVTFPNILLMKENEPVPVDLSFADSNRTVILTPQEPLHSKTLYTVTVKAAPNGPTDLVGFSLVDPFVSSFLVADIEEPTVVSSSPTDGAAGVLPEAVVRLTFSESIAAGFTMTLLDAEGKSVAGRTDLTLGQTVLVFTPTDFLQANTSYTVRVENVTDTVGNPLAGGPFTARFFTVDTIAPVVNALQIEGQPIGGATVAIQPNLSGDDVARVEYLISGQASQIATSAPFSVNVSLPLNTAVLEIVAVAVDRSGNRSAPVTLTLTLIVNQAPTVTLTNKSGITVVKQGQTLEFEVAADDDVALDRVLFSVIGSVSVSMEQVAPAGQKGFTTTFRFTIPASALSNSTFTVQAAAVDSVGQQSAPATLTLQLGDGVLPTAGFASPANDARVVAGQLVDVVIETKDDVAVRTVTLSCEPQLNGCGARTLDPAVASSQQIFTLQIPDTLQAPATIGLTATAQDTAGNTSVSARRRLVIADTIAPAVTLAIENGVTKAIKGQRVTVNVLATDAVGVTTLGVQAEGAFTATDSRTLSPASPAASVNFEIPVPSTAQAGSPVTIGASAQDAAGNSGRSLTVSLPVVDDAPPSVQLTAPAGGSEIIAGTSTTLTAEAKDDVGVAQVAFFVDGASVGVDATAPYEASFRLANGADRSTVTLRAVATDTVGQTSEQTVTIVRRQDQAPPQVAITAPLAGATRFRGLSDVALVIDTSAAAGDVADLDVSGDSVPDTILQAEITSARALLQLLNPATTRVAVVQFADTGVITQALTDDFTLVEQALTALQANSPSGNAELTAALATTTNELIGARARRTAAPVQFVFATGTGAVPTAEAQRAADGGVQINTFAFAASAETTALRQIATTTNSAFLLIPDTQTLTEGLPNVVMFGIEALTVTANATDDVAVKDVSFHLTSSDGAINKTVVDTEAPFGAVFDLQALTGSGELTVIATASDFANHTTISSAVTVTVQPLTTDPVIVRLEPTADVPGNTVEVFGKFFAPTAADTQVFFNGVAATVAESSKIRLAATVPAGATTGPVTVQTDGLTSNAVPFQVGFDADNDGLSDTEEAALGTDPRNPDTDGDGLSDGAEVNTHHTDPLKTDSDGDGLSDGAEVNTHHTDPLKVDTDGDGFSDGFEVANGFDPLNPNDVTIDSDQDGLSDANEVQLGTDRTKPDTDGDGLLDGVEVYTWHTNPKSMDTDGDGLTDGFETANGFDPLVGGQQSQDPDNDGLTNLEEQTHGTDPRKADSDKDGLTDGEEVHTRNTDPLDTDTDDDGLTDGFEVANGFDPLVGGQQSQDPDNDGLTNLEEQTAGSNPTRADTDKDGLNDGDEVHRYQTSPIKADTDGGGRDDGQEVLNRTNPLDPHDDIVAGDTDGDGLSDEEEARLGTNPDKADTDGDGLSDGVEVRNGLNPLDGTDADKDLDADGLTSRQEIALGTDPLDADTDGDRLLDGEEVTAGTGPLRADSDGDGFTDEAELSVGADPLLRASIPLAKLWKGGATTGATDWSNADNWEPAGAPTETDNVLIPVTAQQPTLSTTISVKHIVIEAGATLTLDNSTLTATGDVSALGAIGGTGMLVMNGARSTLTGTVPNVLVQESVVSVGPIVVGDLTIQSGKLDIHRQVVEVQGQFTTYFGVVVMTHAADVLRVQGNVEIQGGDSREKLTAGVLEVGGNFTVNCFTALDFVAGGTQRVVLNGNSPQTVFMNCAGSGNNHFQDVEIANAAGVTFISNVWIAGDLTVRAGTPVSGAINVTVGGDVVLEAGSSLTVNQISVGGSITGAGQFSPETVTLTGSGQELRAGQYQNVTVQGQVQVVESVTISGNLQLSGGGTLDLNGQEVEVGGNLTTSGGQLQLTDMADLVQVAGDVVFQGGDSRDKLTAGVIEVGGDFTVNCFTALDFVAGGTQRVVLNGNSPQTVFMNCAGSNNNHFQDLEIANAAGVTFTSFVQINGTVTVTTGIVTGSSATIVGGLVDSVGDRWQVTNTTVSGGGVLPQRLTTNLTLAAPLVLNAGFTLTGNLTIPSSGALDPHGQVVEVRGNLTTSGGQLQLTDMVDLVRVAGDVVFQGGDSRDKLTAGVIEVGGDFTVNCFSGVDFVAAGTQRVVFKGNSPQTVTMGCASAANNHFQDVEIANAAGVTFTSDLWIAGHLTVRAGTPVSGSSSLTVVGDVTIEADGQLTVSQVSVGGSITGAGQFKPGTTILTGSGQELRAGQYQNVTVQGQVTVVESVVISGNLQLNNGSELDLNGQTMEVGGNLTTSGGQLQLTDMADLVRVAGDVVFQGGDSRDKLTAGVIEVGGDFTVNCFTAVDFVAGGTQRVVLNGNSPQTVFMNCAGPNNNHFQDLEIANASGMTLTTSVQVNGQLIVVPGIAPVVKSNGLSLKTAGVNVDGLVLDNVLLTIDSGVVTHFDNVTFQNYSPAVTQLTINLGVVDATFYGLTFLVEPTTGFYIKANDTDGVGTLARIAMINASPADGSSHTAVTGGFIVTWGIQ